MINLNNENGMRASNGISRRDFLRVGALGVVGLTMSDFYGLQAEGIATGAQAKSVIQIWLGGGPAHTDTFDPKPNAGKDYCGPYRKPLATNVDGMRINEKLPMLAKLGDKYALLRSMTHGHNGHETASYVMQTGTLPGGQLAYPAIGAVVAYKKQQEYKGVLPPFISVTNPTGRFSESGFLGPRYKSFSTGGAPEKEDFYVEGIVARGMDADRLQRRKGLLNSVDTFARKVENSENFQKMDAFQEKAYGLLLGDAKKAFNIKEETLKTRARYGRTRFGQSCLLARRLVEKGVPFVTVNLGGWDTHKQHFEKMDKKLPELDRGLSALIEDLSQRGLLDQTIVVCGGEFGRGPKIQWGAPWNGGRSHFGAAFSYLVAGGGFKGGQIVGSTDNRGEVVSNRPIYPWDFSASIYKLLGIDPRGNLPHPRGGSAFVAPEFGGKQPSGGILTEIM